MLNMLVSSQAVAILDLATGRHKTIFSGPHSLRPGFTISRDEKRIIFGDYPGGLYLAEVRSHARPSIRQLAGSGTCYHASWSPDGKRIVFGWKAAERNLGRARSQSASDQQSLHQLYLLDIDSTDPPKPLPGQNEARNNTNPDWSPDGKTIIFSSQKPVDSR
jgi:Tol biopolymer transport system component